jgi:hypothetical protein
VVCAASIFLPDDARLDPGAAKTKWPVERFPAKGKPVSRKKMLSINICAYSDRRTGIHFYGIGVARPSHLKVRSEQFPISF